MNFFKEILDLLKSEVQEITKFLSAHKIVFFAVIFITILAYGYEIANFTLSIDEELVIRNTDWNPPIAWIKQGRPSIVLIKLLFNTVSVIPFWNTFMAISVLFGATVAWFQVFSKYITQKIKGVAFFIFCSIFLTMPIHAEYMVFSTYNFEVSIGFLLAALSTLFLSHWFSNHTKTGLVIGLLLYIVVVAIYQSFIMVVFCGLSIFLFLYFIELLKQKESIAFKSSLINIVQLLGIIVFVVVIYKIIDILLQNVFPSSGYIEGFFGWKYLNKKIVISNLQEYFKDMILGDKIFGSFLIFPTLMLSGVMGIYYLFKGKEFKLLFFLIIGIGFSPFALSFLIGSPMPLRAMQSLPLMLAGMWLILYQVVDHRTIRNLLFVIVILISLYQTQAMTRLFYSDNQRYKEDISIANRIGERISLLPLAEDTRKSDTVVFVGSYVPSNNPSIIRSEIIGRSFFEWEGGNTYRIIAFMNGLGYDYTSPTKEQLSVSKELSRDMPVWPDLGSIEQKEGIIIVKLSELND